MKKTTKPKVDATKQVARIEYMALEELRKFPKNPKGHDDAALAEAFADRGFATPLMLDETSGLLVEGHGRLERLSVMRAKGEPAPARVKVSPEGKWSVPVVRGIGFEDMDQARRHLIGANAIGAGVWDNRLLADMLSKLGDDGLLGTGFHKEDLAKFMALASGPSAPGVFPEVGSDLETQYCCPKCAYRWSGNPAPNDKAPEEKPAPAKKKRGARAK